jgi:hypothetical protein
MSTATLDFDRAAGTEDTMQYRALDTGAILGLIIGILSVATVIAAANSVEAALMVAPIPVLGMVVCLRSMARIRRAPDLYTGHSLALAGLALSLVFLITGVGYGSYVYFTEVPDGYQRVSFNTLKPDEVQETNGKIVPEVESLNGKKVFIKGYIRPDSVTTNVGIKEFLLVRDNNQCCFGSIDTVKYYDQIKVNMLGSRTVKFKEGSLISIGGTLEVEPSNLQFGPMRPVFTLKADYSPMGT